MYGIDLKLGHTALSCSLVVASVQEVTRRLNRRYIFELAHVWIYTLKVIWDESVNDKRGRIRPTYALPGFIVLKAILLGSFFDNSVNIYGITAKV